jgi:hypothetical protein
MIWKDQKLYTEIEARLRYVLMDFVVISWRWEQTVVSMGELKLEFCFEAEESQRSVKRVTGSTRLANHH